MISPRPVCRGRIERVALIPFGSIPSCLLCLRLLRNFSDQVFRRNESAGQKWQFLDATQFWQPTSQTLVFQGPWRFSVWWKIGNSCAAWIR